MCQSERITGRFNCAVAQQHGENLEFARENCGARRGFVERDLHFNRERIDQCDRKSGCAHLAAYDRNIPNSVERSGVSIRPQPELDCEEIAELRAQCKSVRERNAHVLGHGRNRHHDDGRIDLQRIRCGRIRCGCTRGTRCVPRSSRPKLDVSLSRNSPSVRDRFGIANPEFDAPWICSRRLWNLWRLVQREDSDELGSRCVPRYHERCDVAWQTHHNLPLRVDVRFPVHTRVLPRNPGVTFRTLATLPQ